MRRKMLVLVVIVVTLLWPVSARANDTCLVQSVFVQLLCVPDDPLPPTEVGGVTTVPTTVTLPATR